MAKAGSQPKPTARQLRYLRVLAEQRGRAFTHPRAIREASAEIERLRARKPSSKVEVYIDRKAVDEALGDRGRAAAVRETDVEGYGSTAAWKECG